MESRKMELMNLVVGQEKKMQTLRTNLRTQVGKGSLGRSKTVALTNIHYEM